MAGLVAAAACLPAGFCLAVASGIRPLGGLVMVVLAALAGRASGAPRGVQLRWFALVFVCFVASHLLGLAIGAWPAVAVVTAIAVAGYVVLTMRPGQVVSVDSAYPS